MLAAAQAHSNCSSTSFHLEATGHWTGTNVRSFVFIIAYKGPWWSCASVSKISPLPEWLWTKWPGVSYTCALLVCFWAVRRCFPPIFLAAAVRAADEKFSRAGPAVVWKETLSDLPSQSGCRQDGHFFSEIWQRLQKQGTRKHWSTEPFIWGKLPSGETVWGDTESNEGLSSSGRQRKGDVYEPGEAAQQCLRAGAEHTCPWVIQQDVNPGWHSEILSSRRQWSLAVVLPAFQMTAFK